MNYCKNCHHWKNKQSELDYSVYSGFCVGSHLAFDTVKGCKAQLLDRNNLTAKFMGVNKFEHILHSSTERSRYLLVTLDNFGCNYFEGGKK